MNHQPDKNTVEPLTIINISQCLADQRRQQKPSPRGGWLGRKLCMLLIMFFALSLLPLFLFMCFFNVVYFWLRNHPNISPKPYYNFDRHKVKHISVMDKLWCEYCEWANGTLQWSLAITNEIERRYCPIKNQCKPHCDKAKGWRDNFLEFDHQAEELKSYYKEK